MFFSPSDSNESSQKKKREEKNVTSSSAPSSVCQGLFFLLFQFCFRCRCVYVLIRIDFCSMKDTKTVLPTVNGHGDNQKNGHQPKSKSAEMKTESQSTSAAPPAALPSSTTTTTTSSSKTNNESEELVGGCCVCSDDQGFANNALVYCDGKGCTVACHTGSNSSSSFDFARSLSLSLACYGIVSIPDGDWYCGRCEAGKLRAVRRSIERTTS